MKKSMWQPIETAPKGGEQFLVTDGESVVMAEHPDDELIIHDITSHGFDHPTHWMPLPEPPELLDDKIVNNDGDFGFGLYYWPQNCKEIPLFEGRALIDGEFHLLGRAWRMQEGGKIRISITDSGIEHQVGDIVIVDTRIKLKATPKLDDQKGFK